LNYKQKFSRQNKKKGMKIKRTEVLPRKQLKRKEKKIGKAKAKKNWKK
jgi:hypothetical protein